VNGIPGPSHRCSDLEVAGGHRRNNVQVVSSTTSAHPLGQVRMAGRLSASTPLASTSNEGISPPTVPSVNVSNLLAMGPVFHVINVEVEATDLASGQSPTQIHQT
jgi:hypothetical protein